MLSRILKKTPNYYHRKRSNIQGEDNKYKIKEAYQHMDNYLYQLIAKSNN